jgi:hypothetical protein
MAKASEVSPTSSPSISKTNNAFNEWSC